MPERPADSFVRRGVPDSIRSDNSPVFTAVGVCDSPGRVGVKALSIEPGPPREAGYVESVNGKLRVELPDREEFEFAAWRRRY